MDCYLKGLVKLFRGRIEKKPGHHMNAPITNFLFQETRVYIVHFDYSTPNLEFFSQVRQNVKVKILRYSPHFCCDFVIFPPLSFFPLPLNFFPNGHLHKLYPCQEIDVMKYQEKILPKPDGFQPLCDGQSLKFLIYPLFSELWFFQPSHAGALSLPHPPPLL